MSGGNNDMALMLALIDMLNRSEDREERSALDRDLFNLQKDAQKQAKRTQDRVAFSTEVGSIQGQVKSIRDRRTAAFQRNQEKFITESTKIMGLALDDPGVRSFVRELGNLDQKGESEALRFVNGMADRVEKVLNRIDEPLEKLGAARVLDSAVGNYVTGGGVHANSLEDVYTRGLAGVKSMARKAETVIGELAEQRQTAWEEFLQAHEKPIQRALRSARELGDPLSGLSGIHKQVDIFSDPELSLFTVPSSSFDMPGLRGSIRRVESDRVVKRTPGAPEEVLEEVKGFPSLLGSALSAVSRGVSRGLGGEKTIRTEGGEIPMQGFSSLDPLGSLLQGPRVPIPPLTPEEVPYFLRQDVDPFAFTEMGPPFELRRPPYSGGGGAEF
jgi:hypothetical protein